MRNGWSNVGTMLVVKGTDTSNEKLIKYAAKGGQIGVLNELRTSQQAKANSDCIGMGKGRLLGVLHLGAKLKWSN